MVGYVLIRVYLASSGILGPIIPLLAGKLNIVPELIV